jgi:outer membrane receptor protein involved in Fe transport
MLANPAFAQTPPTADAASSDDVIVVTGSRIARPELDVAAPIVAVTAAAIEQTGQTNITNILLRTPALSSSTGSSLAGGRDANFGETGANLLDLRGLGTNRTLVLVNGKRHVAGIPNSAAVDINTIPQDLIERVDVLTGGASAIYGADGVSGVVNFILKRNFEGVRATAQAGISDYSDAGQQYASVLVGKNFAGGRGNFTLAYEFNNSERVSSFARPFSGDPLQNYGLYRKTTGTPDSASDPARILYNNITWADSAPDGAVSFDLVDGIPSFTGSGLPYDRGLQIPGSGGRAVGGSNTPTAGYFGDIDPATTKHIVNGLFSFEFSPAVRFFAEGKYVNTKSYSVGQPSFDFFTYLAPDNAYLINRFGTVQTQDGALLSRDNLDLGLRGERITRETYRGVAGFDGAITDNANYELSYVYGRTNSTNTQTANLIGDRYYAALDAVDQGRYLTGTPNGNIVCRSTLEAGNIDPNNYDRAATTFQIGANSPCRPLNLLGNGVASAASLAFVLADNTNRYTVEQHVASGSISGTFDSLFKLPGGSIGFAVGAEYRKEKSSFTPDPLIQNGQLRDFSQQPISGGEFDVKEAFAELNAPLLSQRPFFELLSFSAAVRLSDYSTVGKTTTWKLDGIWSPVRDIRFRGTYSQSVRAPNISELFDPQGSTFQFVTDPCDVTRLAEGTQYRVANCRTILSGLGLTAAQIANFSPSTDAQNTTSRLGLTGGNPNLTAETARTWTAGVVLQPRFIPRLTVTFDWYNVKISNAVNTVTPTRLAQLCVDAETVNNQFCANIFRAPGTGFVLGDQNDPQNRIGFIVGPQNVAFFRTSGADFTIRYTVPTASVGSFDLSLVGGYLENYSFVPTIGGTVRDDTLTQFNPRWRGNASVNWTLGAVNINYGLNYQSQTRRVTVEQIKGNPFYSDPKYFFRKELWQHDIRAAVEVGGRFTLYGGVNNVFDQKPSFDDFNYPISGIGRFMYVGAKVKLGAF